VILHRLVGLSLVTAVLALAPAAHASPPDQSRIPGLYDDADFDDVVLLITSNLGAIQPTLDWSSRAGPVPSVSLRRGTPSRAHCFLCHLFSVARLRSPDPAQNVTGRFQA